MRTALDDLDDSPQIDEFSSQELNNENSATEDSSIISSQGKIHIYFLQSVHPWFTALKRWNRWTYGFHIWQGNRFPL